MKFIMTLISLFFACGCAAASDSPVTEDESLGSDTEALCGKNALSQQNEITVLKLIDDICGDTWCSGDDNFAFRRLTCTQPSGALSGSCKLDLTLIPREGSPNYGRTFNRSCTTPSFTGFDSLVYTDTSGRRSLQPDYYLALTDCIGNLEAALNGRN